MSFESLDRILQSLSYLKVSPEQQQLDRAVELWPEIVGEKIARQTRPVKFSREVLQVAVASPVWAQQLRFQRPIFLRALNARLDTPVRDLRFAPGLWHRHEAAVEPNSSFELSEHPSVWGAVSRAEPATASTPQMAFERLAKTLSQRTAGLPLCPVCQCPTPPKELERWSVCALCHASKSRDRPLGNPPF
jgi:predicted nucleic acid-binding Zn ribbon protein